jgi:hypothetical protein
MCIKIELYAHVWHSKTPSLLLDASLSLFLDLAGFFGDRCACGCTASPKFTIEPYTYVWHSNTPNLLHNALINWI